MSLWYRTGTVSVNNGQVTVTGAGTAWVAAEVEPGDAIVLDGRDYEVLTVDSNTAITLVTPYLGATTVGMAYVIKPLSAIARLVQLSDELGQLLDSFGEIARTQGVGRFDAGQMIDNILRPSLRGKADDDTGINLPGHNVLEQWQGGVKTASVAADGTPTGPMWNNAPISTAAAAALAGKSEKAFRATVGGLSDTSQSSTWRAIGVIAMGVTDPTCITVYGTGGYGDLDACSGCTVIFLRGTNDATGRGLEGHFHGMSKGNGTISAVAVFRIDANHWRIFVKTRPYMCLRPVCDTAGSWVPENIDTGSEAQPSGSRLLESLNWWMVDGQQVLGLGATGLEIKAGGLIQGPLAPRTAKKLISGVMPEKGGTTAMEHGVPADKIVSVQVECRYGSDGSWVGPNADGPNLPASHYRFRTWRGPVAVSVGIDPHEGEALVGKPVQAWIEYIVD